MRSKRPLFCQCQLKFSALVQGVKTGQALSNSKRSSRSFLGSLSGPFWEAWSWEESKFNAQCYVQLCYPCPSTDRYSMHSVSLNQQKVSQKEHRTSLAYCLPVVIKLLSRLIRVCFLDRPWDHLQSIDARVQIVNQKVVKKGQPPSFTLDLKHHANSLNRKHRKLNLPC